MGIVLFPKRRPSPTCPNRVTIMALDAVRFIQFAVTVFCPSVSRANFEHDLAEVLGLTD
jgi:hypothetical protein